jgi:hypothetical protein
MGGGGEDGSIKLKKFARAYWDYALPCELKIVQKTIFVVDVKQLNANSRTVKQASAVAHSFGMQHPPSYVVWCFFMTPSPPLTFLFIWLTDQRCFDTTPDRQQDGVVRPN